MAAGISEVPQIIVQEVPLPEPQPEELPLPEPPPEELRLPGPPPEELPTVLPQEPEMQRVPREEERSSTEKLIFFMCMNFYVQCEMKWKLNEMRITVYGGPFL